MILTIEGETKHYNNKMREISKDISKEKREELINRSFDYGVEEIIDFELMREDLEGDSISEIIHILEAIQEEYYINLEDSLCIFQEGNTAKITRDEYNIVRYTSNNKEDNSYFYLSAGDILGIFWKCTQIEVAKRIALMMDIDCKEIKDIQYEETYKLDYNKEKLKDLFNSDNNVSIRKCLGSSGVCTLHFLNDEAKRKLFGNKYRTESGFFFFYASVRYIGLNIEKAPSTVSSAILMLEALGFIITLEIGEIPESVLNATKNLMKERGWVKMPNFYIINIIDDNLVFEANIRAQLLLDNGVRAGKASYKEFIDILGKEYRGR